MWTISNQKRFRFFLSCCHPAMLLRNSSKVLFITFFGMNNVFTLQKGGATTLASGGWCFSIRLERKKAMKRKCQAEVRGNKVSLLC
jgi:hypothetical protein